MHTDTNLAVLNYDPDNNGSLRFFCIQVCNFGNLNCEGVVYLHNLLFESILNATSKKKKDFSIFHSFYSIESGIFFIYCAFTKSEDKYCISAKRLNEKISIQIGEKLPNVKCFVSKTTILELLSYCKKGTVDKKLSIQSFNFLEN
jgi:hypothetical protein